MIHMKRFHPMTGKRLTIFDDDIKKDAIDDIEMMINTFKYVFDDEE